MANDKPDDSLQRKPLAGNARDAHKLPPALQKTLDNDEQMWEVLSSGAGPDSTESDIRYAAYAARVKTILSSAHRYVAYTSDIGESFRPIAHPYLVRGAYAVSWAYLIGDVAHEGYKAYTKNQAANAGGESVAAHDAKTPAPGGLVPGKAATPASAIKDLSAKPPPGIPLIEDYRVIMAERACFQAIASMGLPAFTVHSIVRYSGRAMKDVKNVQLRTWGPIGLGLAAVPALPFIFDAPVEHAVEYVFHAAFAATGGAHKEKEL